MSLRPAWSTDQVQGLLHRETLSQKQTTKKASMALLTLVILVLERQAASLVKLLIPEPVRGPMS